MQYCYWNLNMPAVQNKMKGNKDKQTVKSSNKATP